MDVEDIEIKELGPIKGKLQKAILGIVGILALAGIVLLISSLSRPVPLSAHFTDSTVRPGYSTTLIIEFRNLGNEDLKNVAFRIIPENPGIIVSPSDHVEPVIGAGAYRKLELPVNVTGNLTEGSYRIGIQVNAGEEKFSKDVYLEITK